MHTFGCICIYRSSYKVYHFRKTWRDKKKLNFCTFVQYILCPLTQYIYYSLNNQYNIDCYFVLFNIFVHTKFRIIIFILREENTNFSLSLSLTHTHSRLLLLPSLFTLFTLHTHTHIHTKFFLTLSYLHNISISKLYTTSIFNISKSLLSFS